MRHLHLLLRHLHLLLVHHLLLGYLHLLLVHHLLLHRHLLLHAPAHLLDTLAQILTHLLADLTSKLLHTLACDLLAGHARVLLATAHAEHGAAHLAHLRSHASILAAG